MANSAATRDQGTSAGSSSIVRQISASSQCICWSVALSLPGLLMTMRSTPSAGRSNFSRA
jgi:hypothetical protein